MDEKLLSWTYRERRRDVEMAGMALEPSAPCVVTMGKTMGEALKKDPGEPMLYTELRSFLAMVNYDPEKHEAIAVDAQKKAEASGFSEAAVEEYVVTILDALDPGYAHAVLPVKKEDEKYLREVSEALAAVKRFQAGLDKNSYPLGTDPMTDSGKFYRRDIDIVAEHWNKTQTIAEIESRLLDQEEPPEPVPLQDPQKEFDSIMKAIERNQAHEETAEAVAEMEMDFLSEFENLYFLK